MKHKPEVGFFVTCLIDTLRPQLGFSSLRLLQQSGCAVSVPKTQTCCGQPVFNSGDRASSITIVKMMIESFESFDYIVAPSGSCLATLRNDYPKLLVDDASWHGRTIAFSEKCYELFSFLHDVRGYSPKKVSWQGTVAYHDRGQQFRYSTPPKFLPDRQTRPLSVPRHEALCQC